MDSSERNQNKLSGLRTLTLAGLMMANVAAANPAEASPAIIRTGDGTGSGELNEHANTISTTAHNFSKPTIDLFLRNGIARTSGIADSQLNSGGRDLYEGFIEINLTALSAFMRTYPDAIPASDKFEIFVLEHTQLPPWLPFHLLSEVDLDQNTWVFNVEGEKLRGADILQAGPGSSGAMIRMRVNGTEYALGNIFGGSKAENFLLIARPNEFNQIQQYKIFLKEGKLAMAPIVFE